MMLQRTVSRIGKGLLTANGALLMRAVCQGFCSLEDRFSRAYAAIDPFGNAARLQEEAEDCKTASSHPVDWLRAIPSVHLSELACELATFGLGSSHRFVDGALPWVDLIPLLTIARKCNPRCIFEIGTFYGYTTAVLAQNFPNAVVHTIDLPLSFDLDQDEVAIPKDDFHLIQSRKVGEGFRSNPAIRNVVQHFGDTATWDFSPVKDTDLFFIDGSHTYEYGKNDTEKCLALCQGRRATFLWHDIDVRQLGVVKYLSELASQGYPVKRIDWTHLAIMEIA